MELREGNKYRAIFEDEQREVIFLVEKIIKCSGVEGDVDCLGCVGEIKVKIIKDSKKIYNSNKKWCGVGYRKVYKPIKNNVRKIN